MQHTKAKRFLLMAILPILMLLSCHFHPIYESSGYTLAIYREPAWEVDPLHPEVKPVVYLMSMGEDSQNGWTRIPSMPVVFNSSICDIPGEQRKALVKIDNTVFLDPHAAPIRYIVVSKKHLVNLTLSREIEVANALYKSFLEKDWEAMVEVFDDLEAIDYPYVGTVQPGDHKEVPNLFDW